MNWNRPHRLKQQACVLLLEALVAILIFSLGVLAIIQLQAVSIKQASGAQYRTMAASLANDLIGQMWVSDKTSATLQANFSSDGGGANYTQWMNSVTTSGLPNPSGKVLINSVASPTTGGTTVNQVAVTITWKAPGDDTSHNYAVTAQLIQ